MRILSNPQYPNSPGGPAVVCDMLRDLKAIGQHVFWPDDIELDTSQWLDPTKILTSKQVTDCYLLAVAAKQGGKLATFDTRLNVGAVKDGANHLNLIQ